MNKEGKPRPLLRAPVRYNEKSGPAASERQLSRQLAHRSERRPAPVRHKRGRSLEMPTEKEQNPGA